jgi:hypothetical protein
MTVKQDFSDQLKAQIDVWQAQIKNYQEQLEQASEKARADYEKAIAQMQANAEEANKLLQKVRKAGESAWTDMGKSSFVWRFKSSESEWLDELPSHDPRAIVAARFNWSREKARSSSHATC